MCLKSNIYYRRIYQQLFDIILTPVEENDIYKVIPNRLEDNNNACSIFIPD